MNQINIRMADNGFIVNYWVDGPMGGNDHNFVYATLEEAFEKAKSLLAAAIPATEGQIG